MSQTGGGQAVTVQGVLKGVCTADGVGGVKIEAGEGRMSIKNKEICSHPLGTLSQHTQYGPVSRILFTSWVTTVYRAFRTTVHMVKLLSLSLSMGFSNVS